MASGAPTPVSAPTTPVPEESLLEHIGEGPGNEPAPPTAKKGSRYLDAPSHTPVVRAYNLPHVPEKFLPYLQAQGFLHLAIVDVSFPWRELQGVEFVDAFMSDYIHIEAKGDRSLVQYAPAPESFLKSRFHFLLQGLFFTRWREEFLNGTRDNTSLPLGVYKMDRTLTLACDFIDSPRHLPKDKIAAFRLITFNTTVSVAVKCPSGESARTFFDQRAAFWKDLVELSPGVHIYGSDAFKVSSGNSYTVLLEPNQVLILPSPCSFQPAVNVADLFMVTTLVFRRHAKKEIQEPSPRSLDLAFLPSATLTQYPNEAESYYNVMNQPLQKKVKAAIDATAIISYADSKPHEIYKHSVESIVIFPGSAELVKLLETDRTRETYGFGTVDLARVREFMKSTPGFPINSLEGTTLAENDDISSGRDEGVCNYDEDGSDSDDNVPLTKSKLPKSIKSSTKPPSGSESSVPSSSSSESSDDDSQLQNRSGGKVSGSGDVKSRTENSTSEVAIPDTTVPMDIDTPVPQKTAEQDEDQVTKKPGVAAQEPAKPEDEGSSAPIGMVDTITAVASNAPAVHPVEGQPPPSKRRRRNRRQDRLQRAKRGPKRVETPADKL